MKSKLFLMLAAVMLFGVSFAVYAYTSAPVSADTIAASCCCCSGDSCPMKMDAKATGEKAASHECCCKGDGASCPMKAKGEKASGEHSCPMMAAKKNHDNHDASHKMAAGDAHSCPMMKDGKEGVNHAMHGDKHKADGAGHSCSCPCCSGEKKTTETKAL